ncbi:plasmid segregation protein ParM [Vibrio lentus]|nr:plasmid segregation protein ParM [Vibrio lentus]
MHVVVTLPISEYYGTDHPRTVNIAKKSQHVWPGRSRAKEEAVTISEVVVYPEGLPASESAITSPLRNLNVGDTTLDLCLFSGKAQRIERAKIDRAWHVRRVRGSPEYPNQETQPPSNS